MKPQFKMNPFTVPRAIPMIGVYTRAYFKQFSLESEAHDAERRNSYPGWRERNPSLPPDKRPCCTSVPIAGKFRLIDIPMSNCIYSELAQVFILTKTHELGMM